MLDCTWEIHFDLPPGGEREDYIRLARELKDELSVLRLDYDVQDHESKNRLSIMVGDLETLMTVISEFRAEGFHADALTVQINAPHGVRIQATLDMAEGKTDSARWEELEPW